MFFDFLLLKKVEFLNGLNLLPWMLSFENFTFKDLQDFNTQISVFCSREMLSFENFTLEIFKNLKLKSLSWYVDPIK